MDVIRDLAGYPLSEDHEALWNMAHDQSVVCLVDHHWSDRSNPDGETCVDVAQTLCAGDVVEISVRGNCYVSGWNKAEFIRQCEAANVRWIIPTQLTTRLP